MPSGHDGGVHIMVGPQRGPPPAPFPATPLTPPLAPSPVVPDVPPPPSPVGCRAPPQPATQTNASATARASAPGEPPLDLPEADARLPFPATTTPRMAAFPGRGKRPPDDRQRALSPVSGSVAPPVPPTLAPPSLPTVAPPLPPAPVVPGVPPRGPPEGSRALLPQPATQTNASTTAPSEPPNLSERHACVVFEPTTTPKMA
jgi:hypothetical protein